jgi:ornithine cyclodeaminase
MFLLSETQVRQALDPLQCLQVHKKALVALTDGTSVVPTRLALSYPEKEPFKFIKKSTSDAADWTLIKPAAYYPEQTPSDDKDENVIMGLKVVSIRSQNPSLRGLPLVPATIFLIDAASGLVEATMAGTFITAMRTSAGPALAVQAFQPSVKHLVMFGAGAQAECHVQLMELALKRRIPKITIVNRTLERAEQLMEKIATMRHSESDDKELSVECVVLNDKEALRLALSTADVVAATTNTTASLWADKDNMELKKGCLITGIGSYTPEMQEIPPSVVNRSAVVIDTSEAMEVGDLKHLGTTLEQATSHHPITMAGIALVNPDIVYEQQRSTQKDFIFYKAVGSAIQDVLQAKVVVDKAKELGLGHDFDMS